MQNIVTQYERYMVRIEEMFDGVDVPREIMEFYLLCSLISCGSFKLFHQRYNGIPIDVGIASVGKLEWLGAGELNQFEVEAATLWNRYLTELHRRTDQRKLFLS